MDILDLIKKYGVSIPDDQVDSFTSEFHKGYKSNAEFMKVKNQRDQFETSFNNSEKRVNTLTTEVGTLTTQNSKLTEQVNGFENKAKISKAGTDFVHHEVSQLVNAEKDYDTALNEYVESHSQFKSGTKQNVSTSTNLGGTQSNPSVNEQMNEAILRATGRKK
jgi:capsule polysaccharide export protein KpsE/RkpR